MAQSVQWPLRPPGTLGQTDLQMWCGRDWLNLDPFTDGQLGDLDARFHPATSLSPRPDVLKRSGPANWVTRSRQPIDELCQYGRVLRKGFSVIGFGLAIALLLALPSNAEGLSADASASHTVSSAGFSLDLPNGIPTEAAGRCPVLQGSEYIAGTYWTLRGCLPLFPTGTVVLFGHGGPPLPPIPSTLIGSITTPAGVPIQELQGVENEPGGPGATFLLALLPGFTTWVIIASPGTTSDVLAMEKGIVSSLGIQGDSLWTKLPLAKQPIVGKWHVHDGELTIKSDKSAVISAQSPISATCRCEELDHLTLSARARDGDFTAVVSGIATGYGGDPLRPVSLPCWRTQQWGARSALAL